MIILLLLERKKNSSPYEAKKVNPEIENKLKELWKISSRMLSTTSALLTAPSMPQTSMKSYRTSHHSSKRNPI